MGVDRRPPAVIGPSSKGQGMVAINETVFIFNL